MAREKSRWIVSSVAVTQRYTLAGTSIAICTDRESACLVGLGFGLLKGLQVQQIYQLCGDNIISRAEGKEVAKSERVRGIA